ncbi:N-6 DNA methylase [uncultured Thiothrix sp.]|uniref:N-6 DNA methylase n=1 Tax=uncultured Thiothrix sp. TaxID=223185 RepID=UPI00262C59BA|nr:N-6 DNA methylase [uncultured Thiothrix sp.]
MNLSSTIKTIQDIMRKDAGVDGDAQRIGQLAWMLFLKVLDQREQEWEDDDASYESPLPEPCRWRNWAEYKKDAEGKSAPQLSAEDTLKHINEVLFPTLKELDASSDPLSAVIQGVFEDSNNYMKSGTLLLDVIGKLEEAIDFNDLKNRQQLGDIYEQILNDLRSAGNAGEFYTPRALTHFMVQMVNPRLDKRETVLDPACGTGGFLTATIDHFRAQINTQSSIKDQQAIEASVFGFEKKQLPHLLCTTNFLLHGIEVPSQILHTNTLAKGWSEWSAADKHDCIITNPPFGGTEEDGVGTSYPGATRTRETADMFLVLIVDKLLKQGGRGAIVLPDGTLFGEGVKAKVKEKLLNECNLHTIVRLPNGVFNPYTGIKSNLLFFTKGQPTDTIWYYEHPYPAGYKSYSKTKPIRLEEFEAEKAWWGNEATGFAERVENEFAWKVDFKAKKQDALNRAQPLWQSAEQCGNQAYALENQLKAARDTLKTVEAAKRVELEQQIEALRTQAEALRLQERDEKAAADRIYYAIFNLDLKNPNAPEAESHDPEVLLEKYQSLEFQIAEHITLLKLELAQALMPHAYQEGVFLSDTEEDFLRETTGFEVSHES